MNQKTNNIQFNNLPQWVKDEVMSEESIETNSKIIKKFDLSDKQKSELFKILRNIILKKISLNSNSFLNSLKDIGLDNKETKKLGLVVIKNRFFPLQEYFEQDIREVYKNLGGDLDKDSEEKYKPQKEKKLDKKVDNIIEKLNLEFDSEKFRQRFEDILTLYLKDVQSELETNILLKRGKDIGGLGFDEKKINNILNFIKKNKKSKENVKIDKTLEKEDKISKINKENTKEDNKEEIKTKSDKDKNTEKEDLKKDINFQRDNKLSKDKELKGNIKNEIDLQKQAEDIYNNAVNTSPKRENNNKQSFNQGKEIDLKDKKESHTNNDIAEKIKPTVRRRYQKQTENKDNISNQKKQEKDNINKNIQKAYGPIGEIQTLTLKDFRRWGDSKEAIRKIKDKINLLGEESLMKKAKAIQAWKDSQIYKLYLEVGEDSINKGKPITEVIQEKQKKDVPVLTEEEFNSILELNEDLRF